MKRDIIDFFSRYFTVEICLFQFYLIFFPTGLLVLHFQMLFLIFVWPYVNNQGKKSAFENPYLGMILLLLLTEKYII